MNQLDKISLQGFSAVFDQKNPKIGLTSLDHQLNAGAFGGLAGMRIVTRLIIGGGQ